MAIDKEIMEELYELEAEYGDEDLLDIILHRMNETEAQAIIHDLYTEYRADREEDTSDREYEEWDDARFERD